MPTVSSGRVTSGTGAVTFSNTTVSGTTNQTTTSNSTVASLYVASVTGQNLGNGASIFAGETGTQNIVLDFKTLIGGTGIAVNYNADTVTLTATGQYQSGVTFVSLPDGPGDFVANAVVIGTSNSLTWSTAATTANTVLTFTGNSFQWLAPVPPPVVPTNFLTNVVSTGTGNSLISTTTANTVTLKSLVAGSGIILTSNTTTVTVNAVPQTVSVTSGDNNVLVNATNSTSFSLYLSNTGVVAGTYVYSDIVVDSYGRITNAVSGNVSITANTIIGVLGYVPASANAVVQSVAGRTGNVVLTVSDVSGAAPINSPTLTGNPQAPTPSSNDNSNAIATTAFVKETVQNAIANISVGVTSVGLSSNTSTLSISSSPVTSNGIIEVDLSVVANIAGTYTAPTVIIDQYGRVVQASSNVLGNTSNTSGSYGTGNGTVTSIAVTSNATTINVSGSPITSNGAINVDLAVVTNIAGTYTTPTIVVDQYGRVTQASNTVITTGNGTVTSVSINSNTIVVNDSSNAFDIELSTVSNVAGTYTAATMVVDQYGRVTHAVTNNLSNATGTGNGTVTNVSVISNASTIAVSGSPITSNGVINVDLTPISNVAGTYTAVSVVVDQFGRITNAHSTSLTNGTVTSVGITSNAHTLVITGSNVSNSGTFDVELSTVANVSGVYSTPSSVTVDQYGRISNIVAGTATPSFSGTNVSSTQATNIANVFAGVVGNSAIFNPILGTTRVTVSSGGSPAGVIVDLANGVVTPGTYEKVTVDAYGRVVAGGQLSASDLAGLLAGRTFFTFTGDGSTTNFTLSNSVGTSATDILVSSGNVIQEPTVAYTFSSPTLTFTTAPANGTIIWALGLGSTASGNGSTTSTTVTLTGDVTGTGSGSITTKLANSGVTAGTYSFATVTVNAKGLVTAIAAGTSSGSSSGPTRYSFSVSLDSSGNINATNPFTNLPSGWSANRDAANQMTITHNLGLFPAYVSTYAYNTTNSQWESKIPSGNPTAAFSMAINGTSGTSPNTFTIYGFSATGVNGSASSTVYMNVLI